MDLEEVVSRLRSFSPDVGAVVIFLGVVRSESGRVKKLHYEVSEEMFNKVVNELKMEAKEKFDIFDCEIIHKFGDFDPGSVVFLVAVSSRHRKDGFKACKWLVDQFKARAPVWKKEIGEKEVWL